MPNDGTNFSPVAAEERTGPRVPTTEECEAAFRRAVRRELLIHKALGNPIATMRDGKIVTVPPEEIEIPDEPAG